MRGRVLLQGDVHGNTTAMHRALSAAQKQDAERVIQVGDWGFGWKTEILSVPGASTQCTFTNRVARAALEYGIPVDFIDGNHENFDLLEEVGAFGADSPVEMAPGLRYIPRGTVLEIGDSRVLFIGGAYSVDKPYRKEHISWWQQEEITEADLMKCEAAGRVDVVLSHDVSNGGFRSALALAANGADDLDWLVMKNDQSFPNAAPNRARLDAVWEMARPKLWVHGHYHCFYEADYEGTHFVGLSYENYENAYRIFDL